MSCICSIKLAMLIPNITNAGCNQNLLKEVEAEDLNQRTYI